MVKGKVIDEDEEEEEVEEDDEEEAPDIDPPEKKSAKKKSSEEEESDKVSEPKTGDILNYTKEVDIFVLDGEHNRIPCKDVAQAKILSLNFEIVKLLKKLYKKK